LPKYASVSPYQVLDADELQHLVAQPDRKTAVGIRDYAILLLLAVNGLRESELIGINKEDISEVDGYRIAVIKGKGSKVRRSKIAGSVGSALSNWLEIHTVNAGPLFVAASGKSITKRRLCARTVRYLVKKYTLKAGITRRVSPHALRHAAITHALANGANILKVRDMAGHSSLSTTQRYLHDLNAMSDNAVDYNPLM
jgi:site-specific recombinase XerD